MQLNLKQVISIVIAVLGVLMISTTQLTDLFGAGTAKTITSLAALMNSVLGSALAVITSQGSTVRDVLAMPGVEKLDVNAQANKTLAQLAIDPATDKIAPTREAMTAVTETAKG